MGDHFVLLVDRLITESTLEAAIESINRLQREPASSVCVDMTDDSVSFRRMDIDAGFSGGKFVECKICQDEDEDSNMEIPCSCRGSLMYAHRKCVQRWCNVKGDTICEICHQKFEPDYTAPPRLLHYSGAPMNFRGNWAISRSDMQNHFLSTATINGDFLEQDIDDYPSSRSIIFCRIVATIFMVLLVLRHTLPFVLYGGPGEYSISLFMMVTLRILGILLPIYIMVKAMTIVQRRRNRQYYAPIYPHPSTLVEEHELPRHQPQSHLIYVP